MRSEYQEKRKGFTLIELSIVLVIIGLIVGGVLVGQDLIRTAEMRSVITDLDRFSTAVYTFQGKYSSLPGDMPNATSYWGTASGGCPSGAGSGTQTCNGNGDGKIFSLTTDADGHEMFHFWKHLSDANLVPGSFTGVGGSGGALENVIGQNVPASRISNGGYNLIFYDSSSDPSMFTPLPYGHLMFFAASYSGSLLLNPVISTQTAYRLDLKMDDGKPASGRVLTYTNAFPPTPNCATSAVSATATYNQATKGIACLLMFKMGF